MDIEKQLDNCITKIRFLHADMIKLKDALEGADKHKPEGELK